MKFDLFCSLSQGTDGTFLPLEKIVFKNFLSQASLADSLGFETLWLAESHLSSEVQKKNKNPVIPHFKGEVGLNTDLISLSHLIYSKTKKINLGTAIRNILCNGGPLAHAEAIRYHLFLEQFYERPKRTLNLGFASGRFEYSNKPYFIRPRDSLEKKLWPLVKGKVLEEAGQIFLKSLKGDSFSSKEIESSFLEKKQTDKKISWEDLKKIAQESSNYEMNDTKIRLKKWWEFEETKIIPNEVSLENLNLYLGSHSPEIQELMNTIMNCRVFNLSITSPKIIEETHERMKALFAQRDETWKREYMPRTVLVFLNGEKHLSSKEQSNKAKKHAKKVLESYWKALEGTIDPIKVEKASHNALCGNPEKVLEQLQERFHPEDRLMLWFDLCCHDTEVVENSMKSFFEDVAPHTKGLSS